MLKEFHVSHVQLPTPPLKFKDPITTLISLTINIWGKRTAAANKSSFTNHTAAEQLCGEQATLPTKFTVTCSKEHMPWQGHKRKILKY